MKVETLETLKDIIYDFFPNEEDDMSLDIYWKKFVQIESSFDIIIRSRYFEDIIPLKFPTFTKNISFEFDPEIQSIRLEILTNKNLVYARSRNITKIAEILTTYEEN